MNGWPLSYRHQQRTLAAGAGSERIFDRTDQESPFRMVGFQALFEQVAATTFEFQVRTADETTFTFLKMFGVGTAGSTSKMLWKDLARRQLSGTEENMDVVIPYLDIPSGGGLQITKLAAAENEVADFVIVGFDLTKNVLSRMALGVDPESINYLSDGSVSLNNIEPVFGLQGG